MNPFPGTQNSPYGYNTNSIPDTTNMANFDQLVADPNNLQRLPIQQQQAFLAAKQAQMYATPSSSGSPAPHYMDNNVITSAMDQRPAPTTSTPLAPGVSTNGNFRPPANMSQQAWLAKQQQQQQQMMLQRMDESQRQQFFMMQQQRQQQFLQQQQLQLQMQQQRQQQQTPQQSRPQQMVQQKQPTASPNTVIKPETDLTNTTTNDTSKRHDNDLNAKRVEMVLGMNQEIIRLCIQKQQQPEQHDPEMTLYQARLQSNLTYLATMADISMVKPGDDYKTPTPPDLSDLPTPKNDIAVRIQQRLASVKALFATTVGSPYNQQQQNVVPSAPTRIPTSSASSPVGSERLHSQPQTPQQHHQQSSPQVQHQSTPQGTPQMQHQTTPQTQHQGTPQMQQYGTPHMSQQSTPQMQHQQPTPQMHHQQRTPQMHHQQPTTPVQQQQSTPQMHQQQPIVPPSQQQPTPQMHHQPTPQQQQQQNLRQQQMIAALRQQQMYQQQQMVAKLQSSGLNGMSTPGPMNNNNPMMMNGMDPQLLFRQAQQAQQMAQQQQQQQQAMMNMGLSIPMTSAGSMTPDMMLNNYMNPSQQQQPSPMKSSPNRAMMTPNSSSSTPTTPTNMMSASSSTMDTMPTIPTNMDNDSMNPSDLMNGMINPSMMLNPAMMANMNMYNQQQQQQQASGDDGSGNYQNVMMMMQRLQQQQQQHQHKDFDGQYTNNS